MKMAVWHVYVDDDEEVTSDLPGIVLSDDRIPFASKFDRMRLFKTKGAAKKYIMKELKRLTGLFGLWCNSQFYTINELDASDGGEFQASLSILESGDTKYPRVLGGVQYKAVCRKLRA
jgi:hypothetical protein